MGKPWENHGDPQRDAVFFVFPPRLDEGDGPAGTLQQLAAGDGNERSSERCFGSG